MSSTKDNSERVHTRIDNVLKDVTEIKTLQASIQTDIAWIKENIKNAVESKRWAIGTIIALIALGIAIIK